MSEETETPREDYRSIMLMGSDWGTILGQRAKYLPRQVGIALICPGAKSYEENLRSMQLMSGSADMGIPILSELACFFSKEAHKRKMINRHFHEADMHLLQALESINKAALCFDHARKGTP